MPANLKNYEATFILGESATEQEAKAKVAELKEQIKKQGGSVEKEELWGRRELAYKIRSHRSGFYVTLWFSLPVDQVGALEKHLRFDESIIRSLVTLAYTSAQPGSLYPVAEEESKPARAASRRDREEEPATAEEELRRGSKRAAKEQAPEEKPEDEEISEEDRLKKLDESLDQLLKDEA